MNAGDRSPEDFDPFSRESIENPFPFFAALRERAPVYEITRAGYFMLTRYADIKRVESLEPMIRKIADEYFDDLHGNEVEYMESFALPLPMRVICELVGFNHEDAGRLRKWSDESMDLLSGINTPETFARNIQSASELSAYLRDCFDREKANPGDHVLGDLVRATQGGTEVLSDDEVASVLVQLATAGQETTGSLIGSAVMRLAQDPALQRFLRENPDRIADFIEEVVRLESPFYGHFRVVRRDTEVAGVPLPEGTRVMLAWSSANRDAEQFERPDEIDLDRANKRTHMGFGMGIHMCIGAPLARLEARVAIEKLLASTSSIELAQPDLPLRHVPSLFLRRLESLPLRFSLE